MTDAPLLELDQLTIEACGSGRVVVDRLDLRLQAGQTIGLVGESGSGKTTAALSALGFVRDGMRVAGGSVRVAGTTMALDDERAARPLRGRVASLVPQDPATNLNPSLRIRAALDDILAAHRPDARGAATVREALVGVGLPATPAFAARFPHQLSGGQQQRVLIAAALICEPPLVLLDEPTTGLDVVTQAGVLEEIRRVRAQRDLALLYVSHDLGVIAKVADHVLVLREGRIVEEGPVDQVLTAPRHDYTRDLIAAHDRVAGAFAAARTGRAPQRRAATAREPLLRVEGLGAHHRGRDGTVTAAHDISFEIARGECVALVGESGSGKTTIARAIAGLHRRSHGRVLLGDAELAPTAKARPRELRRRCQIVFQNPYESLNPRQAVVDQVARPARLLRGLSAPEANAVATSLLERVRLPTRLARRLPAELSGGERQRVAIARALAAEPELLVCDEITSALDVSVQAAVIELLDELRDDLALALLFITHDLGVVAAIADRVLILEAGAVCEDGAVQDVFSSPRSTRAAELLDAAERLTLGHEHVAERPSEPQPS